MRLKTAHRGKSPDKSAPEIPAERDIPEAKINGQNIEPDLAVSLENPDTVEIAAGDTANGGADDGALAGELARQQEADAAKFALQRQIEALRRSEALNQQAMQERAANLARVKPPTSEEKLTYWKQNGVDARTLKFLEDNPLMVDHDAMREAATQDAVAAGLDLDSPEFYSTVKDRFDRRWRHVQAAQAATAPEFFQPPPPRPEPVDRPMVSAPVSRQGAANSSRGRLA